jgi:CheY-like chemotaxis protein
MDIIEQKIAGNYNPNKISKDKPSSMKRPGAQSILVVEDDKKLASSFKLILESEGYVVDMAHNSFSAHIKITKNTYDLVILDWHLQDVIGDQIADTIKKKECWHENYLHNRLLLPARRV